MKIKAYTSGIKILGYFQESMIIFIFQIDTIYKPLDWFRGFFPKVIGFYIDLSPLLCVPNYSI